MRRFWNDLNPTIRGFLIIGLIALTIVVLNLYTALASLYVIARIAFLLAIAFFFYLLWRERREEISVWPARSKFALYGGAVLIVPQFADWCTVDIVAEDGLIERIAVVHQDQAVLRDD